MTITWHGHYTIKIITAGTTLVLDPHPKTSSYPAFRGKADMVALTNPTESEMSYLQGITGEPFIIDTPGEYSVSGLTLHGIGWHDNIHVEKNLQRWNIENTTLVHLGALNRTPKDSELQLLEQTTVDILLLPINDKTSLSQKDATNLLTIIEPRVVIPIAYENINSFAKEIGVSPNKKYPKYSTSKTKLPEDGMETIILSS